MTGGNFNRSIAIFGCGIILALAMVASSFALSRFMIRIRQQEENTISAKGLAERKIMSDVGTFGCVISTTGKTQEEAFKALERNYTILKFALQKAGFEAGELEENAPVWEKVYKAIQTRDAAGRETTTQEFSHFRYTRSLRVVSTQIDLVHQQSMELAKLVLSGIDIDVNQPAFYITDLEKYKLELIAEATDSAMQRARITAEKCNSRLGRLITARNGVIQITRPASSDMSDYGYYDTSSREKVMKIVVSATFEAD